MTCSRGPQATICPSASTATWLASPDKVARSWVTITTVKQGVLQRGDEIDEILTAVRIQAGLQPLQPEGRQHEQPGDERDQQPRHTDE